ncbi:MAG: OST3 / OST6 family protein [Promethearchaeota archaeon]|nr:MAG: OST3 / OST6 family protein [Candidatus Lokiarchaeota archaeon]
MKRRKFRKRESKSIKRSEISGSETVLEKIKEKTPWIFGNKIRKPKIKFPSISMGRRISVPSPSKTLLLIIIYVVLFVLQMGAIYIVYRDTISLGATEGGEPIFLYPSISDQFIIEGIVASLLFLIGSLGFILLYQASKYVYNRSTVLKILVIGFVFILVAFIILQIMLSIKTASFREFLSDLIAQY